MYLSQLKLNPNSFKTRRLLLYPYVIHQAICRAFPDATEGGMGRVLYRLDQRRNEDCAILLVQSEKFPDWGKVDLLTPCLMEPPKVKQLEITFTRGQLLYFRLRANPTVKRDGKRLGLLREEDQLAWLNRKAKTSGFAVLSCRIAKEGIEKIRAPDEADSRSFFGVRFDGVLRVEEPNLFLNTIRRGIGSAKGMGYGLLSVAPLRG